MAQSKVIVISRFVALLIFLSSLIPLGFGAWGYSKTKKFLENSVELQAEVIELVEVGGSTFAPRILFTDNQGNEHDLISRTSSYPAKYQVGERVIILFDPTDKHDFRTLDWFSIWGVAVIGLGLGFIDLIVALCVFLFGAKIYNKLCYRFQGRV